MLIGITRDKKLADFLPYKKALENVGAQVKLLYYEDFAIKSDFNKVQGLVISGGIDIDPFIYGSKRNFLTKKINLKRDLFERDLILKAWERNLPVLGICRGIQILNCVFGGDLYQDLDQEFKPCFIPKGHSQSKRNIPRTEVSHEIFIKKNTLMYKIFKKIKLWVNSTHHQSVKNLSNFFKASAYSKEGVIEAIEAKNKTFVLGVQFHPEELWKKYPIFVELFKNFMEAVSVKKIGYFKNERK